MDENKVINICKALSDANRLRIVQNLTKGEKCACDLLETLQVTQPTLSHHMKILADAGLVSARKEGKWTHYSLNCDVLTDYREFIAGLRCEESTTTQNGGCCK